jgi:hypothetical protein
MYQSRAQDDAAQERSSHAIELLTEVFTGG